MLPAERVVCPGLEGEADRTEGAAQNLDACAVFRSGREDGGRAGVEGAAHQAKLIHSCPGDVAPAADARGQGVACVCQYGVALDGLGHHAAV